MNRDRAKYKSRTALHGDHASALLKAAEGIRDDLLMRAEFDGEDKVVACGCGAWIRLNAAIDAFKEGGVGRG